MTALEWLALITGICFVIGIVAGSLIVMSIPMLSCLPAILRQPSRRAPRELSGTAAATAAAGETGPGASEPGHRADLPDGTWWRDVG